MALESILVPIAVPAFVTNAPFRIFDHYFFGTSCVFFSCSMGLFGMFFAGQLSLKWFLTKTTFIGPYSIMLISNMFLVSLFLNMKKKNLTLSMIYFFLDNAPNCLFGCIIQKRTNLLPDMKTFFGSIGYIHHYEMGLRIWNDDSYQIYIFPFCHIGRTLWQHLCQEL